jgi:hypothetical protein
MPPSVQLGNVCIKYVEKSPLHLLMHSPKNAMVVCSVVSKSTEFQRVM